MLTDDFVDKWVDHITPLEAAFELDRLATLIHYHNQLYFQKDTPEITDAAYDALVIRNRKIELRFPHLRRKDSPTHYVGGPLATGFGKVRHRSPMLSLENAFQEEEMKDFFDRCYYPALNRINGRPYAVLVCAGSDGQNAVRQIDRIATGWRLRRTAEALIVCTHAQSPETILSRKTISPPDLDRCRELGAAFATGLAIGVF